MKRKNERARWLLLIHQLPAEPAYLRVKVGRRLLRVGAVALKNSVYVLPWSDASREDFSWIRREIVDEGGDASLLEAEALEGLADEDIERLFREARAKDYDQLGRELGAIRGASKPGKPPERQATLAALSRLEEQLNALERVDYFPSGAGSALRDDLLRTRAELETRSTVQAGPSAADVRLDVADYQGRTWITRAGVKVDRVACAWLIRRHIDRTAKFKFVDMGRYARRAAELRFDMPDAEFTHEGDLCSFEVLCKRFGLTQAGLARIAEIVHDLDIKDARYQRPETEGVRALIDGIVAQHTRDDARIEAATTLFDALSRSAQAPATRVGRRARASPRRTK